MTCLTARNFAITNQNRINQQMARREFGVRQDGLARVLAAPCFNFRRTCRYFIDHPKQSLLHANSKSKYDSSIEFPQNLSLTNKVSFNSTQIFKKHSKSQRLKFNACISRRTNSVTNLTRVTRSDYILFASNSTKKLLKKFHFPSLPLPSHSCLIQSALK